MAGQADDGGVKECGSKDRWSERRIEGREE